ncbi:MAG TPA: hypothetical protein VLD37_01665 [Candidatus Bilamarchaeum sp.]|nr:hypothetical protein [Candidatus Bilamarchaeum sp.]
MSYAESVLKEGVRRNTRSIAAFVENAAFADRTFSPDCLKGRAFRVSGPIDEPRLEAAKGDEKVSGLIHIGGEMCNSWTTNYELHTFIAGAMLAAAATALRGRFGEYRAMEAGQRRRRIESDIHALDEAALAGAFRRPSYGILSQFVDDVEGDRYAKAHLWGMEERSSARFVHNIKKGDMGKLNGHAPTELFTEDDIEMARLVLSRADDLFHAKAVQMHFSIRAFLSKIGLGMDGIPLYFSSTPNLHIGALEEGHPFFSVLLSAAGNRKLYGSLVQDDKPWIVKTPCPSCKIESKYIIKARLAADGKAFRSVCQDRERAIVNEVGWEGGTLRGCGNEWHESMPEDGKAMAAFLKRRAVGMHFPINMSLMLMRSGIPVIGSMFEDPGWTYDGEKLVKVPDYPTGDNPDMIMSVMASELAVACGRLGGLPADEIAGALPLMMSQHPQIMDPLVKQRKNGEVLAFGTTNSSISALYRHGMSPLEIFDRTLSLQHYPFGTISGFRGRLDIPAMIREANERGIYVPSG